MEASELVIGITHSNITHTAARREAQRKGARVIALPESEGEDFFTVPGWNADFPALRPKIESLAKRLTNTTEARVTSAEGTDITMSLEGRSGRALTGYANISDVSAGYGLEASIAPLEGTANGQIVVNSSVPGVVQIKKNPIHIDVKDGFAYSISGGDEADILREFLKSFNDPLVYNIAELGIGMNPNCVPDGRMLTDENILGNIQLALGTSAYIGGSTYASAHYDTIVTGATLMLDGEKVLTGRDVFV
jgi:leucyl aminopeptidase (aminopeptidase T)